MILPNPKVLFSKLGDEAVILHLDSEEYFNLDQVGVRMWEVICEKQEIEASIPVLLEEYDVDKDTLRRDLEAFVSKLVAENLLEHA